MLTITYSVDVLSREHQDAQRILAALEQSLHDVPPYDRNRIDLNWLEKVFRKLMNMNSFCHERMVERYIMPAMSRLAYAGDCKFAQLDALGADSRRILRYACEQAQRILKGKKADPDTLVLAIDLYCKQLHTRFLLEENVLLPAAYRLLSAEEWFQIAAQRMLGATVTRRSCRQAYYYGIPGRACSYRPRYAH